MEKTMNRTLWRSFNFLGSMATLNGLYASIADKTFYWHIFGIAALLFVGALTFKEGKNGK